MEKTEDQGASLAKIIDRNITTLLARHRQQQERRSLADRTADRITAFTGSVRFVYLHAVIFGAWIIINLGWVPFIKPFDSSFVILAMVASVEAIFLSTFVLITQNRMAEMAEKRADLDLQISLLAEHEITRLVTLTRAMAARMGLEESHDPELSELARDVEPEKVLDRIEEHTGNA
jgi:uncharacterized membrane protein